MLDPQQQMMSGASIANDMVPPPTQPPPPMNTGPVQQQMAPEPPPQTQQQDPNAPPQAPQLPPDQVEAIRAAAQKEMFEQLAARGLIADPQEKQRAELERQQAELRSRENEFDEAFRKEFIAAAQAAKESGDDLGPYKWLYQKAMNDAVRVAETRFSEEHKRTLGSLYERIEADDKAMFFKQNPDLAPAQQAIEQIVGKGVPVDLVLELKKTIEESTKQSLQKSAVEDSLRNQLGWGSSSYMSPGSRGSSTGQDPDMISKATLMKEIYEAQRTGDTAKRNDLIRRWRTSS